MAGERMRLDGYQELSAVCTHPDYTGRGYAQRLLAILCNLAFDRGFTPFLHVYADNERAIGVYRKMNFVDRTVLRHSGRCTSDRDRDRAPGPA